MKVWNLENTILLALHSQTTVVAHGIIAYKYVYYNLGNVCSQKFSKHYFSNNKFLYSAGMYENFHMWIYKYVQVKMVNHTVSFCSDHLLT